MIDIASSPRATESAGARWIRAALQVNPYEYAGRNAPKRHFDTETAYNDALIAKCKDQSIELMAVADHWCVDSAKGLIDASATAGIVALPGFEANSSEGIHILVMFEAGTEFAEIYAAIGACGVSPGCVNGTVGASFDQILSIVSSRGALAIPAHANVASSGMLTGRGGTPLVGMVLHKDLHAICITPSEVDANDQVAIFSGTSPYVRQHPVAMIYSDDVCHPDALSSEGGSTWFKASALALNSPKLAVRTPQTRVRTSDPEVSTRAIIREISWEGGLLDGIAIPLADDLTAFIGGRGTGKSTVIESLRFVLEEEPLGADAKLDHEGIVSKVLGTGSVVRLVVDTVTPHPARFMIERSVRNPARVFDSSGTIVPLRPLDVVGVVEIYGQHELAELAQDKGRVAQMVERFAGAEDAGVSEKPIHLELSANRRRLDDLEINQAQLELELADLERLGAQVEAFSKSDLPAKLQEQEVIGKEEARFKEGNVRVSAVKSTIKILVESASTMGLTAPYEAVDGSSETLFTERVAAATAALAEVVSEAISNIGAELAVAENEITEAYRGWTDATGPKRALHGDVLRKLFADGHDPDKYLSTVAALNQLRAKFPRREQIEVAHETLVVERRELLNRLATVRAGAVTQLHNAVRMANVATGGVVNVRPVAAVDRGNLEEVIKNNLKGAKNTIIDAVNAADFSVAAFMVAVRGGVEPLATNYNIRGAQAASLLAGGEKLNRILEEQHIPLAVDVFLDTTPGAGRDYRKLDELPKVKRLPRFFCYSWVHRSVHSLLTSLRTIWTIDLYMTGWSISFVS